MRGERASIVDARSKAERDTFIKICLKHVSNLNDNSKTTTADAVKNMNHIAAMIKEQFEPSTRNPEATEEATASTLEISKGRSKHVE